ncbi:UNVERIFIED_CONTAM: hypothetical protein PYX00_011424 [Menopon gallinae]|uniref:Uncharacterized protein n=1 Tax=Menopon gallinae TaxID=328185 RepID=A0AAW2H7K3_9NEOP
MTRNSELELISLYGKRQRILESQSRSAKLELDRVALALRQQISSLETRIRELEAMHSEVKEKSDMLRRENDELRQMLKGSQRKVQRDHAGLEKESSSLRRENTRLEELVARLEQEKERAEGQSRGLLEESARSAEQTARLQAENSALARENERLKRDVRVGSEKAAQDIESARAELERRNRELECSNKELGASLLHMQLQYNDLLVKNAEILKNACAKDGAGRKHAAEDAGPACGGEADSVGSGQKAVQREDVVAILRELLNQSSSGGTDTQASQNVVLPAYGAKQPKSSRKEHAVGGRLAAAGLPARGPGRPPGKRPALQPERALPKETPPAGTAVAAPGTLCPPEEKAGDRGDASCANSNAGAAAVPESHARQAACGAAGGGSGEQEAAAPRRRPRAGPPAGRAIAQRLHAAKVLGAVPAKKAAGAAKDTGVPNKEISKIDNESFFANLTFSSSSPFFKKSLRPLFDIVRSERSFRVQVVSLEPFSTLVELFNYKGISYKLIMSPADSYRKSKVNIIVHDSPLECSAPGKYLLYLNRRNEGFVQIVFSVGLDEKVRHCCLRYGPQARRIVQAYGSSRTLGGLEKMMARKTLEMPPPPLSYVETVVLLCVRGSSFDKICRQVLQMDSSLDNAFTIWLTLNELACRNFVTRSGSRFKANVSRELLEKACQKASIDTGLFL